MLIDKITIAVENMEAMSAFYAAVFGAQLKARGPLHVGRIGELEVVLCPREIAGVVAQQNTIQLRHVVDDVERALKTALASGGTPLNDIRSLAGRRMAAVRDPDGNSVELIQR